MIMKTSNARRTGYEKELVVGWSAVELRMRIDGRYRYYTVVSDTTSKP